MTAGNVAVVRRLFEAVEERDLEAMYEVYDPEVVIREAGSLPYGGEYHGHQGVVEHAIGYLRTWDRLQTEQDRRLEAELCADRDRVFVRWRQKAHADDGRSLNLPAVSAYRLRAGRVVEATMPHFDTAALLGLLGQRAIASAALDVKSGSSATIESPSCDPRGRADEQRKRA